MLTFRDQLLFRYHGNNNEIVMADLKSVERVQTGLRLERRLLKVMKGVAELHEIGLGDLVEGVMLHAFEGKLPFGQASLERIKQLKQVYDLDLTAGDSHQLQEKTNG
jgi:hypothetical protein